MNYDYDDHLQSATLITDYEGSVYERINYTPYGELWLEKSDNNGENYLPYRFTGKELDSETGLYYYGARYLDPMYSRWLSTDPALSDYIPQAPINDEARKHNQNLPGMGGVFNQLNCDLYHYAGNNPVRYTDPDGNQIALPFLPPVFVPSNDLSPDKSHSGKVLGDDECLKTQRKRNSDNKEKSNADNVGDSLKQNAQSPSAAAGSPAPNDNDNNDDDENDDDFDNDDYEHTQRIGRSNGKTPRNNQVQNQQVKNISKKYKLTKDEQEQLHDEITHKGYDYSEVEKIAQEIVKERGL